MAGLDPTAIERLYSIGTEKLVAKTIDTVINASPITLKLLGNQKPWKSIFPVKWQTGISGTAYSSGTTKFSTALSNSFEKMRFNPSGYSVNVSLDQLELDMASGGLNTVIDFMARELESRAEDMIDAIGTLFNTLQTGENFYSLLDAADNESLGPATYGGLDRSTYGLQGIYTATAGAMSMSNLRTKYNNCTHGGSHPNLIIATKANWARYEALIITTTSYGTVVYSNTGYPQMTRTGFAPSTQGLKGDRAFDALFYSGQPFVFDEKVNTHHLHMINTEHLAFYGLPSTEPDYKPFTFGQNSSIQSVYTDMPKTTGFSFGKFQKPIDQYAKVAHIILQGNLIADSPRHQGIEVSYTS